MRSRLNIDSTHHLVFSDAWLILEDEVMLEKSKISMSCEISFVEMDEDGYL
jgi:hypothetical protein